MRRNRRGNALVEAAVVLPVLLSLAFGTVEFGHFFYMKHLLQSAAREGARAAIPGSATNADVTTAVNRVLNSAGIPQANYTTTLSPATISGQPEGTAITVTVTASWGTVGLRPMRMIATTKQVIGVTVMRKEAT